MKKRLWVQCAVLSILLSLPFTAFGQKVTTLSNGQLFSQQYAQAVTTMTMDNDGVAFKNEKIKKNIELKNRESTTLDRYPQKSEILQTAWGGTVGFIFGSFVGGCMGLIASPMLEEEEGSRSEIDGAFKEMQMAGVGACIGGILGCGLGVNHVGKKYRKGSFWVALSGAVVPTLAAYGISKMPEKQNEKIILYTWLTAPITTTAVYYIFSDEKSDTSK